MKRTERSNLQRKSVVESLLHLLTSLERRLTIWHTVVWPSAELESFKAFLGSEEVEVGGGWVEEGIRP